MIDNRAIPSRCEFSDWIDTDHCERRPQILLWGLSGGQEPLMLCHLHAERVMRAEIGARIREPFYPRLDAKEKANDS